MPIRQVVTSKGRRPSRIGASFPRVLEQAWRGDAAGFERLYGAFAGSVAGYLRTQGVGDADDLANQVFFDAFSAIARFHGDEDSFRSWLFTIAHRRVIDDRRRQGRRPQPADHDSALLSEQPGGDAEDDALCRLSTHRVRDLCESLMPDQRDVLLLRMVAGLSIEETAEALGKTQTAVKALQRRAVGALRRSFEREGISL